MARAAGSQAAAMTYGRRSQYNAGQPSALQYDKHGIGSRLRRSRGTCPLRPEEEMEVVREAAAVALEGTGAWEAGSEVGWTVAEERD